MQTTLAHHAGMYTKTTGVKDEHRLAAYMRQQFPKRTIREATHQENITQDIDIWVDDIPVSIKCYNPNTNHNFLFEMQKLGTDAKWRDSWFRTGSASKYVIWHKGTEQVYLLSKEKIVAYEAQRLAQRLPPFDMVKQLTQWVKQQQAAINHPDRDVRNGLVPIQRFVELGVAVVVGTLTVAQAQQLA